MAHNRTRRDLLTIKAQQELRTAFVRLPNLAGTSEISVHSVFSGIEEELPYGNRDRRHPNALSFPQNRAGPGDGQHSGDCGAGLGTRLSRTGPCRPWRPSPCGDSRRPISSRSTGSPTARIPSARRRARAPVSYPTGLACRPLHTARTRPVDPRTVVAWPASRSAGLVVVGRRRLVLLRRARLSISGICV